LIFSATKFSFSGLILYMLVHASCLQMAIYESILASPYRTLNGEEADFFLVPVLDSCIITRADDSPHLSLEVLLWRDNDMMHEFTHFRI